MTVYKAIDAAGQESPPKSRSPWPKAKEVPQDKVTEEIDNGKAKVPSVLLEPVAVTKDNVKSTVIADEFVTAGRTLHRRLRARPAKKRGSRAEA